MLSCVQLSVTPWTVATRRLCPWDSPGRNTGVDCHFLLQRIFPTQVSNPDLLHHSKILYRPSPQGSNISSVQFSRLVVSDSLDPMNRSMPGLPVHHQLLEFIQTHVHWVSDATQSSHPLSSPSPPAPNPSQHQSFPMSQLFISSGQSIGVSALASVLPMNTQDSSPLEGTGWISLRSKGLSRVFSNTIVQKHQFFGSQLSSQSNSHIHTWPLEKP